MGKREDFDVVIIGSGVSGLVCGCYLQKAGLKVAILEAREEAGGCRMAAELMRPGYLIQSVWGDMDPLMMYQLDLGLDQYGYQDQEMIIETGFGTLYKDETCLVSHSSDPRKTAENIARFSEKDAKKMLEIAEYMAEPFDGKIPRFVKFMELYLTEPWTWENFDIFLNLIAPLFPFKDPYELTDLNAFELLNLMYESEKVKTFCASLGLAVGLFPQYTGGGGIIFALSALSGFNSHPKNSSHSLAHVYIRCFRALGGKLFNGCPVRKIIIAGGEAKGVILDNHAAFPGKEITAKKVVTNLNPRTTFTELVGEEHVGKKVIQKLKTNWKAEVSFVTVCYALKKMPQFAAEKFDPDVVNVSSGGMGAQTLEEIIHAVGERFSGRIPHVPVVCFGLPHKDDPTQSREGNCVVVAFWLLPYAVYEKGGAEIWDDRDFRREINETVLNVYEEHFPGFKEIVIDYWMTTPLDRERQNMNYLRGDISAGSFTAPQMFFANRADIEGFDKGGIVTPIKNLYGSGAVGPVLSCGGNGYRAACHIAEELKIRNQPWWTHRMLEYVTKKYIEKTYVPLKPTSILDR